MKTNCGVAGNRGFYEVRGCAAGRGVRKRTARSACVKEPIGEECGQFLGRIEPCLRQRRAEYGPNQNGEAAPVERAEGIFVCDVIAVSDLCLGIEFFDDGGNDIAFSGRATRNSNPRSKSSSRNEGSPANGFQSSRISAASRLLRGRGFRAVNGDASGLDLGTRSQAGPRDSTPGLQQQFLSLAVKRQLAVASIRQQALQSMCAPNFEMNPMAQAWLSLRLPDVPMR